MNADDMEVLRNSIAAAEKPLNEEIARLREDAKVARIEFLRLRDIQKSDAITLRVLQGNEARLGAALRQLREWLAEVHGDIEGSQRAHNGVLIRNLDAILRDYPEDTPTKEEP